MPSYRTNVSVKQVSATASTNGNATTAHGMPGTPKVVLAGILGDQTVEVDVQALDGTNITWRFRQADGTDQTSGTYTVMYVAYLDEMN